MLPIFEKSRFVHFCQFLSTFTLVLGTYLAPNLKMELLTKRMYQLTPKTQTVCSILIIPT